jgi:hypothetical protein
MLIKKWPYAIALLAFLAIGCSKKDSPVVPVPDPPKPPVTPVKTNYKKPQIDSIRRVLEGGKYKIAKDSVWKDSLGVSFFVADSVSEFGVTAKNADGAYPGSLFAIADLKKLAFTPITNYEKLPITVFTDAWNVDKFSDVIVPSKKTADDALSKIIASATGPRKQINSQSSGKTEFTSYSLTAKYLLGIGDGFSSLLTPKLQPGTADIQKKTGLILYYITSYYSYRIDGVIDPFFNKNQYPDLASRSAVVSGINYGRVGMVFLESDSSWTSLSGAVARATDGKGQPAQNDISILKAATAHVYYKDLNGEKLVDQNNLNGYDRLLEFKKINALYNETDKGVPISFYLQSVADFGIYYNIFVRPLVYHLH